MVTFLGTRLLIWTTVILCSTVSQNASTPGVRLGPSPAVKGPENRNNCSSQQFESFALRDGSLKVFTTNGGIIFTAGMTIDADGAPNAYAPRNRGLDYTANARGVGGWVALVTNQDGRPITQTSGRYRGYYVSTTSLQQNNIHDLRSPKKYIDATKVPYIALPPDFANTFGIELGDLAVVVNQTNGRFTYAIFADVGPKGRIGEGSIALAKALGIPADPRHDSVTGGVTYLVFPGSVLPAETLVTARQVRSSTARLYHRWGGTQRLRGATSFVPPEDCAAVEY